MAVLKIVGWRAGLQKIPMTKLLREKLGINLAHAKGITDDVLKGKRIFINLDEREKAESLADELFEIGAIVKIEHES